MKNRIKSVIYVLSVLVLIAVSAYVNDYYRASEVALQVVDRAEYLADEILVFKPDSMTEEVTCGMIFYPGGKVEYTAYAPLLKSCAEEGIMCVLVHMPCNLAVLDVNAAEGIQEQFSEVEEWYMAGHSLGGSMAASYIEGHVEQFKGLILLAAYSTEDLSSTKISVLSVYGTEDQVLNRDKYKEYQNNLPINYTEAVIEGGCHAYFGNYGEQEGDGVAEITCEKQQEITVEVIKNFVK